MKTTTPALLTPIAREGLSVMNTHRRRLLHLAALSTTALALPGRSLATVSRET